MRHASIIGTIFVYGLPPQQQEPDRLGEHCGKTYAAVYPASVVDSFEVGGTEIIYVSTRWKCHSGRSNPP